MEIDIVKRKELIDLLLKRNVELGTNFEMFPHDITQQERELSKEIATKCIMEGFENLKEYFNHYGIPYRSTESDENMFMWCWIDYGTKFNLETPYRIKFWDISKHTSYGKINYKAKREGLTLIEFYKAYNFSYIEPTKIDKKRILKSINKCVNKSGKVEIKNNAKGIREYHILKAMAEYIDVTVEELIKEMGYEIENIEDEVINYEENLKNEIYEIYKSDDTLNELKVYNIKNHPEVFRKLSNLSRYKMTTVKTIVTEMGFEYLHHLTYENMVQVKEELLDIFPNGIVYSLDNVSESTKIKIKTFKIHDTKTNEEVIEWLGLKNPTEDEKIVYELSNKYSEINIDKLDKKYVNKLNDEIIEKLREKEIKVYSPKYEFYIKYGRSNDDAKELLNWENGITKL